MDQAVEESERKRYSQVIDVIKKTIIDALEMCVVEGQYRDVRSIVWLVIRLIIDHGLVKGLIAEQLQMAAMRAIAHPVMIHVFTDNLLNENQLTVPMTTFVQNYVENKSTPFETRGRLPWAKNKGSRFTFVIPDVRSSERKQNVIQMY